MNFPLPNYMLVRALRSVTPIKPLGLKLGRVSIEQIEAEINSPFLRYLIFETVFCQHYITIEAKY